MKKQLLTFGLGLATALSSMAVSALHEFYPQVQPDGSTIMLMPMGNEYAACYKTQDGLTVLADETGAYRYATVNSDGLMVLSDYLAHQADQRTADEAAYVRSINHTSVSHAYSAVAMNTIQTKLQAREGVRAAANDDDTTNPYHRKGLLKDSYPYKGNVKALVVLVEFPDMSFEMEDPHDYFHRQLNERGFSDNGATGSARDYYIDNSRGQFIPEFDVFGPVMMPLKESYYGANLYNGNNQLLLLDANAPMMAVHAAEILHEETDINFADYDTDHDGLVDVIYFIYAGIGEAYGGDSTTLWPHNSTISSHQEAMQMQPNFDGVKIENYACSSELIVQNGRQRTNGIGTLVHEYAHVVGLPDLYTTAGAANYSTPCKWSVMDQGNYLNNSNTPLGLSAYERNALGWMGDNLIELDGPGRATLPAVSSTNTAFVVGNPNNDDEFFIFENRLQQGWDEYLLYPGMLVWHIYYDKMTFKANAVNNVIDKMCVDLVEANGKDQSNSSTSQGTPFPGKSNITTFNGPKGFKWRYGSAKLSLDDIDLHPITKMVMFDVIGSGDEKQHTTNAQQLAADQKALVELNDLLAAKRDELADPTAGEEAETAINALATAMQAAQQESAYTTPITGLDIAKVKEAIAAATGSTGITDIIVDSDNVINGPATYYNLQGQRVATPASGNLYIKTDGQKAVKVMVK